jgi:hypothetical protein
MLGFWEFMVNLTGVNIYTVGQMDDPVNLLSQDETEGVNGGLRVRLAFSGGSDLPWGANKNQTLLKRLLGREHKRKAIAGLARSGEGFLEQKRGWPRRQPVASSDETLTSADEPEHDPPRFRCGLRLPGSIKSLAQ